MEQAHPQQDTEKPLKELRLNAHDPLLKDSLMLLHAQGEKSIFQKRFETENAYLFSRSQLRRDTSDAVYHTVAKGYSLNDSIFCRYEMIIMDISKRGLKSFRLGAEIATRPVLGPDSSQRYVDLDVMLDKQDVRRVLSQPLFGALNHIPPLNDEITARDIRENQELAEIIERGSLPVTFEVDRMVENDNHRAMNRLYRVLKAGAYVSQLVAVSTQPQSSRYAPIYTPPKMTQRPYVGVRDIDTYLDTAFGPVPTDVAEMSGSTDYFNNHNESIRHAG